MPSSPAGVSHQQPKNDRRGSKGKRARGGKVDDIAGRQLDGFRLDGGWMSSRPTAVVLITINIL